MGQKKLIKFAAIKEYENVLEYPQGMPGKWAAYFNELEKGTINIGDRQRGRIRADSVIDCEPTHQSILNAIKNLYSNDFQSQLSKIKSPYGEGGATQLIMRVLEQTTLSGILKKQFYDKKII